MSKVIEVMAPFSILERLKTGDEQAWSDEFPRPWEIAFAAARLEVRSDEDAEDAAIDAFKDLMGSIASAKSMEDVDKLLWTISKRRAVSLVRKLTAAKRPQIIDSKRPGPEGEQFSIFDLIPDSHPSSDPVPMLTFEKVNVPALNSLIPPRLNDSELEELRRIISSVIMDHVEEPGRSIWQDHSWHDLSYEELAKKYGKTAGAVRVLFFRSNAKIVRIILESPDLVKRLRDFLR